MFLTREQLIKRFFKKVLYIIECTAFVLVAEFLFFAMAIFFN